MVIAYLHPGLASLDLRLWLFLQSALPHHLRSRYDAEQNYFGGIVT